MFSFLLCCCLVSSYSIKCESDLKHAPPVEGAEMLWVGVVTRHGVRTPMDSWTPKDVSGTWICDSADAQSPRMHIGASNNVRRRYQRVIDPKYASFQPNCESGELLIEGMNQHLQLGRFYRDWLVNETKFLNPWLEKSQVSARVSKVERCQRSAVSFMNGFYPPVAPNEKFEFTSGSDYREFLYPSSSSCKDMSDLWDKFVQSDDFDKRKKGALDLYADIYKNISLAPDESNWMFIGDWISSYLCTNQTVPVVTLNDTIITQALKDIAYFSYGYFGTNRAVAGSAIWRKIFADIDDFIAMKQTIGKFRLYSSHDTTIIALIVALGFMDDKLPPFRSHLAIELWKKNGKLMIRAVFNGEPVPIDFMGSETLVDYVALKYKMSERGDLKYCLPEFPA